MRLQDSLSIVTVASLGDGEYVRANIELIALLNSDSDYRVYVLDNRTGPDSERLDMKIDLVTVLEGVPQDTSYSAHCRGSYHHAAALNRFMRDARLETRYLLILDPDFYILHEGWIVDVLSYMDEKNLSFFGAPWHPKWFTKYRYFPCAHCMFIDRAKINLKDLDFTPDLVERSLAKEKKIEKMQQKSREAAADNTLSTECLSQARFLRKMRAVAKGLAVMVVNRRLIRSSDDTGYLIHRTFANNNGHEHECLTPVLDYRTDFLSLPHLRISLSRWIEGVFPDSLSFTPKRGTFVTEVDCKDMGSLSGVDSAWEKFFWNGKPFAFHMRRYNTIDREPQMELRCLRNVGVQALGLLGFGSDREFDKSSFFHIEHRAW